MEEILPNLKNMLKEAIEIETNLSELVITLVVKSKIEGIIAEPEEVIVMLKMYGGLTEEIPMEIKINNESQSITLIFQNEEDFNRVAKIFETILDNAVDLINQALESDFSRIKTIPNIDD